MKVLVRVFVLNFQRHLVKLHVESQVSSCAPFLSSPGHQKMFKELNNGQRIPLIGRKYYFNIL